MNKETIEKVKKLISKSRMEDAIDLVEKNLTDPDLQHNLNLISEEYSEFKKQKNRGFFASFREESSIRSQLASRLLDLLSSAEDETDDSAQNETEEIVEKNTILFIGASPDFSQGDSPENLKPLKIADEYEIVMSKLEDHSYFKVEPVIKATKEKLHQAILDFQPKILHFACHSNAMGIYLEDENGNPDLFPTKALKNFATS